MSAPSESADADDAPLWSGRRRRMLRAVVWLGIIALVLPGILVTWGVAAATAARACSVYTAGLRPTATGSDARFELVGPTGPGWQCYAEQGTGPEAYIGPMGVIPSAPHLQRDRTDT